MADVIYSYSFRALGRIRKKLLIILADASPLPNRTTFVEIPENAITIAEPSDAGYRDNTAIGMPTPATYRVTFHLGELGTTAELQELRARLLRFECENAGTLPVAGGSSFTTSNVFIIKRHLPGGGYATEYIGVQRRIPGGNGEILIGRGVALEYELCHISRAVMEAISMADICLTTINLTSHVAPWKEKRYNAVYDILVSAGGRRWAWAHHGGGWASFFQLVKLFEAIQFCCDYVFRAFLRLGIGSGYFRFRSHLANDYASPWDHWVFHKQSYQTDHQTGSPLTRDKIGFMGAIRQEPDGEPFAGLLYPGQDSLYVFGTLHDFLRAACDAGVCRGVVAVPDDEHCEFWFYRPLHATETQLTLDDIIVERSKRRIPFKLGEKPILTVQAQLRGKQGADKDSYKYRYGGAATDQGYTIKAIWDTSPTLGERDWYGAMEISGIFSGSHEYRIFNRRFYPWKFYYIDQPLDAIEPMVLRVHDSPSIDLRGLSLYPGNQGFVNIPWPAPNPVQWSTFASGISRTIVELFRTAIAATQQISGMQRLCANALNYVFGKPDLTSYQISVKGAVAPYASVGQAFILPESITGNFDANGLLATGEDYLDLPGWCILVNYKFDPRKNRATCIFQGLRS